MSLGGVVSQSRSFQPAGPVRISSDFNLEANYGYCFLHANVAALYGELEFVALPNRSATTATAIVPKNYASFYVAPGLRLKFAPGARLSPWVAAGGGYALYQQSAQFSNGQSTTNKFLNRGVFDFGGGLDYTLFRFLGSGRGSRSRIRQSKPERRVVLEYAAQRHKQPGNNRPVLNQEFDREPDALRNHVW